MARRGDHWVAQAIEVDHSVLGTSADDVKQLFERSLYISVEENLERFGHVQHLLTPARPESWTPLLPTEDELPHTHVAHHRFFPPTGISFPFGNIAYTVPPDQSAE